MGGTSYNYSSRTARAASKGYDKVTVETSHTVFKQKIERKAHESMMSQGITLREARDSDVHPHTVPVVFVLDVTGSMQNIPVMLIKDGLPKIISNLIQHGIKDVALLFMAVGDHKVDKYPLQIGQFESGDEELDMWLTRTYPEGGGGANEGESYGLAYNFIANNIVTDAWEKRKEKGIVIMVGDEPALNHYSANAMKEVTGNPQATAFELDDVLNKVKEKWHVFHINPHGTYDENYWKPKLGQNYISLDTYTKVPETVVDIVMNHSSIIPPAPPGVEEEQEQDSSESTEDSGPGFVK